MDDRTALAAAWSCAVLHPSMHSDDSFHEADVEPTFEAELEALVLRAFARGVAVEGAWDVTLPVEDAPNWRISVRKVDAAGPDDAPADE